MPRCAFYPRLCFFFATPTGKTWGGKGTDDVMHYEQLLDDFRLFLLKKKTLWVKIRLSSSVDR